MHTHTGAVHHAMSCIEWMKDGGCVMERGGGSSDPNNENFTVLCRYLSFPGTPNIQMLHLVVTTVGNKGVPLRREDCAGCMRETRTSDSKGKSIG